MSHHCEHHEGQDCDCKGECKEGDCKCSEGCGSEGCCGHDERCCGGSCHCGGAGPCHGGHFQRRYQTKAEQVAELEAYLGELKLEVQAVEERLADLRK